MGSYLLTIPKIQRLVAENREAQARIQALSAGRVLEEMRRLFRPE
jgi:hypothetical protein